MTEFLVEIYAPCDDAAAVERRAAQGRMAGVSEAVER
jgi:hypothetical protein